MLLLDRLPVRFRLSGGHAIWMAVLFFAVGFGLYRTVESRILDSVDAALLASAKSVRDARFVQSRGGHPVELFFKHFFSEPVYVDQLFGQRVVRPYAQLINMSGKVSSRSANLRVKLPVTPEAVSRAEQGLITFEDFFQNGKPLLRQLTMPVMRQGRFTGELIQVGATLEHVKQNLRGIALVLWVGFPLGLLGSVFLGYVLARRALAPVRAINSAARSLGIDDLSVRLPLPAANDELRELSATFNEMLDRLEEAVKRLRRFTGDVSHELRTPLAVLRGEAELALRRARTTEEYKTVIRSVGKESIHMTKIVEDLLLLARAEDKSVAMHWSCIDVGCFVQETAKFSERVFSECEVRLIVNIMPTVKSFSASRNFLSLILKNLLENAAKHSSKGSDVTLNVSQKDSFLFFEVVDQGEGIPPESIPLIFDSFYRADTARNRAAGGVGIGLSLARALVKLHHGSIYVESSVGQGAIFTIKIPMECDTDADTAATARVATLSQGSFWRRIKIHLERVLRLSKLSRSSRTRGSEAICDV